MRVTTFLMFTGKAEEAMNVYTVLFPDSKIETIERYGPDGPGPPGSVKLAVMNLAGTRYMCIDSPAAHAFTFTPSISLFVALDTREHLDAVYAALSDGGTILMPPGAYGFSTWFTWLQDRFGVSWQLNLP